jgi:uncharacterized Fe-S cluster-containing protein
METAIATTLPGLDCGLCGSPTCEEFEVRLADTPDLIKRCIHLDTKASVGVMGLPSPAHASCGSQSCSAASPVVQLRTLHDGTRQYRDSLGREFDFVLQHFPEEPGPREIIIPHNPMLTREMDLSVGDVLIGRPLGMSCGCPVTHCGEVIEVDRRTGVLTWCVTGPLRPRQQGFKDIGYYIAEAYEGLVRASRSELKIGMRYYFQPDMCMLQWRHSGLVNYLNRTASGLQVRLEGLWIG